MRLRDDDAQARRGGHDLSRCSLRRRNRQSIGDLPGARELLKEMVAQGAAIFALNPDARFHLDPAKAGVALRADGVSSLHAVLLPQALRQIQRSNLESG